MKYIKTYESRKYNTGDYVLLNTRSVLNPPDTIAKITGYDSRKPFPYIVKFYNNDATHVKENEIIKKLTPKEIEDYKAAIMANKYNL